MATKAPKKTAAKKTTARKSTTKTTEAPKSIDEQIQEAVEAERTAKSCAYPGCSQRASQEAGGDKKVPSCDIHASVFNDQHDDGAGIQQLIANWKDE